MVTDRTTPTRATSTRATPTRGVAPGANAPTPRAARELLARADLLLSESIGAHSPQDQFLGAYLAALRGAGAVLAAVEGPGGMRGSRTRNAWLRLAGAAPEFTAWADHFAGYSATRSAVEAGGARSLSGEEADRFFVDVGRFLHEVESFLVGSAQPDLRAS
ncbi:hypothetical protein SAMN05444695_102185 [Rhodococcus triatomae]|uniref:SAV-6107-like HEPN domain-containing protein n=1 Tax=Rhodococcus triatomae TaxID=300028 RepID=A0A1G8D3I8_9NOCA|nr:hypothetical protein SAMN05444695_102185 [Rhodococcus triatomae]